MTIWSGELRELDKLYTTFRGHLPDIVRELEQLLKTDDPNVVMLYSRRCLEVIITDLCETELNRPRKTEPLKGIIDKLNSEEKVPSHIITSMLSLNSMANYGAHPKDFDPEQVKPVLNNLAIIIKWYLKHKDFQVVSRSEPRDEESQKAAAQAPVPAKKEGKSGSRRLIWLVAGVLIIIAVVVFKILTGKTKEEDNKRYMAIEAYELVRIGNQMWMAENLRTTYFNDGTPIPEVKDMKEWENLVTPGYCWYDNDREYNGETYGALYNWFAVSTGKLCPVGWHVPTEEDWFELSAFLGDTLSYVYEGDSLVLASPFAGIKMKASEPELWENYDGVYSDNETGFSALPGGHRTIYGVFWGLGQDAFWWSSTESQINPKDAKNRELHYDYNGLTEIQQYKQFGMSVRCIKDKSISDDNKPN